MTLVVLGIDALDAAQVEHFDIDAFKLNTHGEMGTFAHQNPIPHTGEVWPSVATGLHPSEHGITHGGESKWDNVLIEYASRAVGPYISMHRRADLGRWIRRLTGADWEINETNDPTFFDGEGRHVHNWPGTINGNEVRKIWRHINHTVEKGDPQEDFDRELCATEAEKFGWVREMLSFDTVVVGSHIHLLDASGHAYGKNEEHYRWFYEKAASYVEEIRDTMDENDELLILSDHGMNTTWLENDYEICHHSFRAYSASTLDSRPKDVFDVKEWVEEHVGSHQREYDRQREDTDLDMPEDTLRELGYID
jgi:predicted AlkP superfamily pyrophosphatase or phosphodiesterase